MVLRMNIKLTRRVVEKKAKKVAQAIVDSRFMMRSIDTTWELAQLVETALSDG